MGSRTGNYMFYKGFEEGRYEGKIESIIILLDSEGDKEYEKIVYKKIVKKYTKYQIQQALFYIRIGIDCKKIMKDCKRREK